MIDVTSSTIRKVGWEAKKLTILFRSGEVYVFDDVPQAEYESLLKAESVGQHFHQHIRGKYPTQKLLEHVGVTIPAATPVNTKPAQIKSKPVKLPEEECAPWFEII